MPTKKSKPQSRNARRRAQKKSSVPVSMRFGVPSRNARNSMAVQPTPGDHAHTIALCNPFSEEAVGAKIPDDDSTKSVAVTVKDTFPMNTDSNGRADCRFSPRVGGNVALHATVSGSAGVTTWGTGNTLTDLAAYQGAFDSYRIVGWGLKVTNLLPPTDRSGYFRVITCPEDPGAVTPYITNGGLHEDIKIFPASEDDIHWISKPVGSQYKLYNQWTGDVPVWDYCHVRYEGGPASKAAAILVQVVFHLECQIELGKVTATMATAAAPHKPHVLTAAANTLAKHGGAHAGSTFGGLISRFAKSALQGAVNHFLPGFYGGPSYPSIMNVD